MQLLLAAKQNFAGEISGSTDLIIDGEVDGVIRLTGAKLTVRADGRVKATIAAQDVVIAGKLEGEIRAMGRVELRDGSVVLATSAPRACPLKMELRCAAAWIPLELRNLFPAALHTLESLRHSNAGDPNDV